jgi:uncharacterized delta-60 repeat protein
MAQIWAGGPQFIDSTFVPLLAGSAATINRTIVQPDGKILVAGNFHQVNGAAHGYIVRFNSDGTLDTSFVTNAGQNNQVMAMALQPDGKIVIGGNFTNYASQTVGDIVRLNPDGSFDASFNSGGIRNTAGANSTVSDISVTSDGHIYIVGAFSTYNGTSINRVARLNSNGNLDTTFNVGTGANSSVNAITQVANNKILIGGLFTSYNGTSISRLARINSDGSLDATFVSGTGPNNSVKVMTVQPDGKIVVGGSFTSYNGTTKSGICRISADGADDAGFTVSTGSGINTVVVQPDGKLLVGGNFTTIAGNAQKGIARLNSDGSFDSTFNVGTGLLNASPIAATVNAIALQPDGRVFLEGAFISYNGQARSSIVRTDASGTLDTNFNPSVTLAGQVWGSATQPDGKLIIGGSFSAVNGVARTNVARLNSDGSLDTTFDPGAGADALVTGFGVQADGKIIIGGEFTHYNGTAINGIARLNSDGSLDSSFNVGTGTLSGGFPGDIYTVAFQPDGKILIGGGLGAYNNVVIGNVARLNTDGSLDSGFAIGTGGNSTVRKIIYQTDNNEILIGGDFSGFNGTANRMVRLTSTGSPAGDFNPGTIGGAVKDILRQADGKMVIAGSFTSVNGTTRNKVARLNSDGTLDSTFDPGVGFTSDVVTIAPTPEGKYIVGGAFTTASGLARNRLARLHADGSIDPKFLMGLGPIAQSQLTVRQVIPFNGKYLITGTFETYNTSARTGLVLISNATKAPVDYDGDGKTDYAIARQYGGIGRWTYWINTSAKGQVASFDFGIFGPDALQPGDYDGDGMTDVAVWRGQAAADGSSPNGYWIVLSSTNQLKFIPFGQNGDVTTMEDYDGDGKDDPSVWRDPQVVGAQATWFYMGSLNNPNNAITYVPFGTRYGSQGDQVDKTIIGDFDGDGKADFRVDRRLDTTVSTLSTPNIIYTQTAKGAISYDYFGWAGDRVLPGDYDGDGKTDMAITRGFNIAPHATTWFIRYTGGQPDAQFDFGAGALDMFAQGDYDGDGITDPTVYRRAGENNFYVLRSSDHTVSVFHWGAPDPTPGGLGSDYAVAFYNSR